jgi:UDP-GlcNAc:undecaprenyl-phosphate GlcNAc-1-phosphate transferase
MASFLAVGVYRGLWRYTSVDDLIVFAKAVVLGSIGSVLVILFAFRFAGFSRTIFVLDAVLMFLFLAGSRMAFRLFRQLLPAGANPNGRRILIYGAGDGGELLLRELLNNRALELSPVGSLTTSVEAREGAPWLARFCRKATLVRCKQQEDEIVISSLKMSEERVRIVNSCRELQIRVGTSGCSSQ